MRKTKLSLTIVIILAMCFIPFAHSQETTISDTNSTFGGNVTAEKFFESDGTYVTPIYKVLWSDGTLGDLEGVGLNATIKRANLNYGILSSWLNITDRPTFLSQFLNDAGYLTSGNVTVNIDSALHNITRLNFNLTPSLTPIMGDLFYDVTNKVPAFKGEDWTLQIGQEMYIIMYNDKGYTIPNAKSVYQDGSIGDQPTLELANAADISTGIVLGVTTQPIAPGQTGMVTIIGLVHDVDTSAWTPGTTLYTSAVSPGVLTNVKPIAPAYAMSVGQVVKQDAVDGSVFVRPRTAEVDPIWESEKVLYYNKTEVDNLIVAETDPVFISNNGSIWSAINGKLSATDQRYNETTLINLKLDITDQRYNDTALIGGKLDATDQRYNDTAAINLKLDITDQRYNNTIVISLVNQTAIGKASPGSCPSGQFVVNTTTGGVVCGFFTEVDPVWALAQPGIQNQLNNKLNITDDRFNDTAYVDGKISGLQTQTITDASNYYPVKTVEAALEKNWEYHVDSASSGLIEGGQITKSGLQINIEAGEGYVKNGETYTEVFWNNITNYGSFSTGQTYVIYIDGSGNPYISSVNTLSTDILLGGVYNMNGTLFVFNDPNNLANIDYRQNMYGLKGLGASLSGNGMVFTLQSDNVTMSTVSSGTVYTPHGEFIVPTLTNFTIFYQNGLGNWAPLTVQTNIINRTHYNPGGLTLSPLTPGYWKKDVIIVDYVNKAAYYVLGQSQFATREEALASSLPTLPTLLTDVAIYDYALLNNGTDPVLGNIVDIRPSMSRLFGYGSIASGATSSIVEWTNILNKPFWADTGYSASGSYLDLTGSVFSVKSDVLDSTFVKGSGVNRTIPIWTANKTLGDSPITMNILDDIFVNINQMTLGSTTDVQSPQADLLGSDIPTKAHIIDGTDAQGRGYLIAQDGLAVWDMSVYQGELSKYLYLGYNYRSGETAFTVSETGMIGVNKQDNILEYHAGFTGTGINDMVVSGVYTGKAPSDFEVKVISPTQFEYRLNYNGYGFGSWSSPITITGVAQLLEYGVNVIFPSSGSYTANDLWYFTGFSSDPTGTFTVSVPGYMEILNYNGATWNDFTWEAGTTGGTPQTFLASTSSYLYMGRPVPFGSSYFVLQTPATGATLKLEYYDGAAWQTLTSTQKLRDQTNNLANSGTISWDTGLFTWSKNVSVEDYPAGDYYWIRISTTSTPSVSAKAYSIIPQGGDRFAVYSAPYDSTASFKVDAEGNTKVTGTLTVDGTIINTGLSGYNDTGYINTALTNFYNKTASDARYLQSYTETDPIWNSQKVNYSTKAEDYLNDSLSFLAIGDQRYNNTAAINLKLDITDQRYNDTSAINLVNITANTKASPGTCSAGQYATQTTTTGVVCSTPTAGTPTLFYGHIYSTTVGGAITMTTQNTWYNMTGLASSGPMNGVYKADQTLVINETGVYELGWMLSGAVNNNDNIEMQMLINNVAEPTTWVAERFSNGVPNTININTLHSMTKGDSIHVQVRDVTRSGSQITMNQRQFYVKQ
jgi:hypothetical protein